MSDTDKLWIEYSKSKDLEIRNLLIEEYAQLVKYVAGRLDLKLGQYIEYDDLVGYGIFGLIDAIDKYDYTKGIKFETYASLRIRGSIIDSIRKLDWVPRMVRQKNKDFEKIYKELENKLGKTPTDDEIANHLQISKEEVIELINKSNVNSLISLDEYNEQTGGQYISYEKMEEKIRPDEDIMRSNVKDMLLEALECLNEKEKYVVNLYYFDELSLKEISKVLEVSESRISQIHSKAIFKLNNKLGDKKELLMNL